jgi:D-beta-D-heptose 7-phosphate kinase / D-beta-D-heptose 1-phosphate adenosyltransferase
VTGRPVVVIGDALLDVDVEGTVDRLCPDAPAPVLAVTEERARPGGAALAAALVAGRGVPVRLVTALEDDESGRRLRALLDGAVDLVTGPATGGTVVKCRWRTRGRSLLRTDRGAGRPADGFGTAVAAALDEALAGAGAVLVSDYGRGVTSDPAVRQALARAVARRLPVVWDPHPRGADPVPGVSVVTPNLAEARGAAGTDTQGSGVSAALALAADLVRRWDARAVAVTLGARGAVVRHRHGACAAAPAPTVAETDPCGAGDHFAGGVAAALAGGATVDEAVAAAVAGAAEFVARGGGGAVRRVGDAWGQPDGAGPARPAHPVTGLSAAKALAERVRAGGGTVVATGGLFGRLHAGHAETLAAAHALGDCLLVLVNSDASARRRPVPATPLADRVAALAALGGVDGVVAFDGDDPRAVLDVLRPDLWVKGGDHDPADLPETPLVRSWGGEVIAVPYRGNVPDDVTSAAASRTSSTPTASSVGSGSAANGSPRRTVGSPSARCGPSAGGPHWAGSTGPNSTTDGVP